MLTHASPAPSDMLRQGINPSNRHEILSSPDQLFSTDSSGHLVSRSTRAVDIPSPPCDYTVRVSSFSRCTMCHAAHGTCQDFSYDARFALASCEIRTRQPVDTICLGTASLGLDATLTV